MLRAELALGDVDKAVDDHLAFVRRRMEAAALVATDRARRVAESRIRGAMTGAGLGRLGRAFASDSDLEAGRGVHRSSNGGFSASGTVFVRSRSERTLGAIEAYTRGADIRPQRGRWLWIATNEIPSKAGRYRMTPETYRSNGFEKKIGPLVFVKGVNGYPLLVVKSASVSAAGKIGGAKARTKTGKVKKGQVGKEFIVAFVGVPRTARSARVDVTGILRRVQAELPAMFDAAMGGH
jgi:hypothetical protein